MKKISDKVFCAIFIVMLIVPLIFTNVRKNQISEIDNSYLPEIEWDGTETAKEKIKSIEEYLSMRAGFRNEIITAYQIINDRAFGKLVHPSYMYGEDGYIYLRYNKYIRDYQHLNIDGSWTRKFTKTMQKFSDVSHENGAEFIYMLIPDKKTVYPEHFPKGINVKGDVSRTDQVIEKLSTTDIDWFYCLDTMLEAKERMPVNNMKFDPSHWNENGAYVCILELYDHIRAYYPDVHVPEEDEYYKLEVNKNYLDESWFPINEKVPKYTLKSVHAYSDKSWLDSNVRLNLEEYRRRYVNPAAADKPKLLVFNDSYLMRKEKFFMENFSEVTFIHNHNVLQSEEFEYYLKMLDPDIVVYENPERVFPVRFDQPPENND